MNFKFFFTSTLFLLLISVTLNAQNNPDFYVENGTCKCPDANFGDTGTLTINGQTQTFTKRSRSQLDALIANDINDDEIALTCTSGITDMSNLFQSFPSNDFNQNINHWDVSNVTDMSVMFANATSFNQPLNNWNVSNVSFTFGMFAFASSFNQSLDNWDVSNVTDMNGMFSHATSFNQSLNTWDVSNVTNMREMFVAASSFNQPLDNWDVSSVTDMSFMFRGNYNDGGSAFNQSLNNWDVSNVTDMDNMFENATSFDQSLNNWDVSNVTNMSNMFNEATSFNQPLNNWDVSIVTDMGSMFSGAYDFNQPLNNWDVSNVTDMFFMFSSATSFNKDISNWCVEQIPTEPTDFSFDSPLQDSFKPDWGADCTLGIEDNALVDVSVYPNPVKESFRLEVSDNMKLQKMMIYSISGLLVDEIEDLSQPIDVSSLKTGVYILRIVSTSGKIMNKRIIKR